MIPPPLGPETLDELERLRERRILDSIERGPYFRALERAAPALIAAARRVESLEEYNNGLLAANEGLATNVEEVLARLAEVEQERDRLRQQNHEAASKRDKETHQLKLEHLQWKHLFDAAHEFVRKELDGPEPFVGYSMMDVAIHGVLAERVAKLDAQIAAMHPPETPR